MKPKAIVLVTYSASITRSLIESLAAKGWDFTMNDFEAQRQYRDWIKAVNPNAKVYVYRNGEAVYGTSPSGRNVTPLPEYYEALDNDAVLYKVTDPSVEVHNLNTDWDHETLIDPWNPWWKQYLYRVMEGLVSRGWTDGFFMDLLGRPTCPNQWHHPYITTTYNPNDPDYQGYKPNIKDPRTGLPFRHYDWYLAQLDVIDYLKIMGLPIIGNAIPQGDGFWGYWQFPDRSDELVRHMDGAMLEGAWGWSASDLASRTEAKWKLNLDALSRITALDRIGYHSAGTTSNPTFTCCSFLLADDGPKYNWKVGQYSTMIAEPVNSLHQFDYGYEVERVKKIGGSVYRKIYQHARVYVNASSTTSYFVEEIGITLAKQTGYIQYVEYPEPPSDNVYLTYQSIPAGIPADIEGTPIQDGEAVEVLRGSQVKLKVPLRVEL